MGLFWQALDWRFCVQVCFNLLPKKTATTAMPARVSTAAHNPLTQIVPTAWTGRPEGFKAAPNIRLYQRPWQRVGPDAAMVFLFV